MLVRYVRMASLMLSNASSSVSPCETHPLRVGARGTTTQHSDIDLLVVAPTTERFYERMGSALAVVRDISRGLPLAPIVVTPEELSARLARGDQFMQEIVETGMEL